MEPAAGLCEPRCLYLVSAAPVDPLPARTLVYFQTKRSVQNTEISMTSKMVALKKKIALLKLGNSVGPAEGCFGISACTEQGTWSLTTDPLSAERSQDTPPGCWISLALPQEPPAIMSSSFAEDGFAHVCIRNSTILVIFKLLKTF